MDSSRGSSLSQGLATTYGRGVAAVTALDQVSVAFGRGRFTAVMGPSGSGKSTLLHCLAGLDTVDSGTVRIGDTDLTTLDERRLTRLRREHVGFVFQSYNQACRSTIDRLPAEAPPSDGANPADVPALPEFAKCVRQHGYPNFPDPGADGRFPASIKQDHSRLFQDATMACTRLNPDANGQIYVR